MLIGLIFPEHQKWKIPACLYLVGQGFPEVEVRRVELLSKHILQKLSTCLFCFLVSETNWESAFAEAMADKQTTD